MKLEILDTTLRDGEQTSGVAFTSHEKLSIARYLLDEVGVDRVEVASARVSEGELEGVKRIAKWAKQKKRIHQIEVLGFVDGGESVAWIKEAGCEVINLLMKGSYKHCVEQLRKTPEQHIEDVLKNIDIARENGLSVNLYLEDWSNGIINSPEYVHFMMDHLKNAGVKRFMLPDTLGILSPYET